MMFKLKFIIFWLLIFIVSSVTARIHYVGVGPNCDGPNDHSSLALALFAAALNGSENDEIRLTNTVNYQGNGDGSNVLSGWNSGSAGTLIIAGGYADCGDPVNDTQAIIGGGDDAVFDIQNQSEVTLRRMQVYGSASRGIIVRNASTVFLDSVDVSFNQAGIRVLDGSYLSLSDFSIIQNNGDLVDIPRGGGLWCFGSNSEVDIAGTVAFNQADRGGNVFVEGGCLVRLAGGSRIQGNDELNQYNANEGGGVYVDNGGTLFANGGASRVVIEDNWAENGGGVYVNGTGRATFLNTLFLNNMAELHGAGLFAINGGTSVNQVTIDRADECPFLISCSEFQENKYRFSVVKVENSKVLMQRTLFDRNSGNQFATLPTDLVINLGGVLQMSRINFIKNESYWLSSYLGQSEVSHVTAVDNYYQLEGEPRSDSFAFSTNSLGSIRIENSIYQDTQGVSDAGGANISGKCNLVDDGTNWPGGMFVVRDAEFINPAGGDSRQLASSPGVDMCFQDTFAWSTERDIEYQDAPVNENTNPQGMPGEGGLYDAGFDEVYDNIGEDQFLLTIERLGSGDGVVFSDPIGILCGNDCTEVIFNGTLVELTANPLSGSEFVRWLGCPLSNENTCFITVTESATVRAEFQPDDLIFANSFE